MRWYGLVVALVGLVLLLLSWRSVRLADGRPPLPGAVVLRNKAGMEVHILPTGASIQRLMVPDREGKLEDVVLGRKVRCEPCHALPDCRTAVCKCGTLWLRAQKQIQERNLHGPRKT